MIPFPAQKYGIIYADPPWSYNDRGCSGACEKHYRTMKLSDICALPVADIAADDCALFLWATYPMLPEALKVIEAWGFRYKGIAFQWVKQNRSGSGYFFGLGHWTRANSEPCLLAVKGRPKRVSASVSQIIAAPVLRHSQKPDEARQKIVELMGNLPCIELFARAQSPGWDCWGDEIQQQKQMKF